MGKANRGAEENVRAHWSGRRLAAITNSLSEIFVERLWWGSLVNLPGVEETHALGELIQNASNTMSEVTREPYCGAVAFVLTWALHTVDSSVMLMVQLPSLSL